MSSYTKSTDFASKDALLTGNPLKVVKGTEIDDEFNAIQTAVNSKADTNSPTLSGTPTAPTATLGTDTTQLATTAFVQDAVEKTGHIDTAQLADDSVTEAKIDDNAVGTDALNVADTGTAGQRLISDGDGSMSWEDVSDYTDTDALSLLNASGSAPVFAARAWANFDGTDGSIRASGNIASITRTATGTYTVTFTTALSDANYAFIGRVNGAGSGRENQLFTTAQTTGGMTLEVEREETESNQDSSELSFVVFR